MDLQNLDNFDKMCRICLKMSSFLTSISQYNIITMIKACASVNIWLNDELPNQICKICYKRLQDSFDFKQLCEKSDNNLRLVIDKHKNNKNEISVDDRDTQISSKNILQNTRKDSDEQTQDSSIEDHEEQNLDNKVFSRSENSNICNDETSMKREDSVECDDEETFSIKNETLHSDEDNITDECKEVENISKSNVLLECDTKKIFVCEECDSKFKNAWSFGYHMRRVHKTKNAQCNDQNESEKSFVCEQCDGKFKNAWGFGYHMRRVHKAKGTKCRYCSLICYHEKHLKFHENSHTRSVFKCDVCNESFSHRFKLIKHMDSHKTERPFYCVQCDFAFKSKWTLKKHNATMHADTQKYTECDVCGKSIGIYHIQKHLLTHGERETYSCKLCDKKFFHETSLKVHVERIHENAARECKYLCNICGRGTISVSELRVHLRIHTGEKPFSCDKCDKKYIKKTLLKKHISRAHLNERNYVCSVCLRAFYDHKILENHMRIHTGERPFQCRICDKTFGFKAALYTHMKMHIK